MPHLRIEHSDNLDGFDAAACLAEAHAFLARSGHFEAFDIKGRAVALSVHRVGTEDAGHAFIAACLSLLAGRSPDAKRDLSRGLLACLEDHVPRGTGLAIQLSVEVVDIDRDSYAKAIVDAR